LYYQNIVAPLNARKKTQLINIIDRSEKEFHGRSVIPLVE